MDAIPNRELDRMLAEKAGWRVVHHKESDTYALVTGENHLFVANVLKDHKLYAHNKFIDLVPLGERKTEAEAWNDCPLYSTDLNAAITLVQHTQPNHFTLEYSPDRMNWRAEFDDFSQTVFADARTPAAAICLAFIDWLALERR